eukprot:NODE_2269_length_1246_cov_14.474520_g2067_i0.p1 GENE.NODE_2269_length_1246_cov_14.474520_g2067_i0~~NODE_2269_length_1246_cov_14.474520_g2067_i0.p1  ORF type:complete len:337 (+),score=86.66 NODE_2269_length_1246_cov_14.474520_g2067_i0:144-1154(+)
MGKKAALKKKQNTSASDDGTPEQGSKESPAVEDAPVTVTPTPPALQPAKKPKKKKRDESEQPSEPEKSGTTQKVAQAVPEKAAAPKKAEEFNFEDEEGDNDAASNADLSDDDVAGGESAAKKQKISESKTSGPALHPKMRKKMFLAFDTAQFFAAVMKRKIPSVEKVRWQPGGRYLPFWVPAEKVEEVAALKEIKILGETLRIERNRNYRGDPSVNPLIAFGTLATAMSKSLVKRVDRDLKVDMVKQYFNGVMVFCTDDGKFPKTCLGVVFELRDPVVRDNTYYAELADRGFRGRGAFGRGLETARGRGGRGGRGRGGHRGGGRRGGGGAFRGGRR